MPYRDDVEALAARAAVLAAEVDVLERERDAAQARVKRAKLPVLDSVRVASPCTAAWADMTGDARVRHCAHCDKDVFDLSAMTRDEAEGLLLARGNLCIRYYRRADATILLADCPVGAKRRRSRHRVVASLVLVAGTAVSYYEVTGWLDRINREHDNGMAEVREGVYESRATMGEYTVDRPDVPSER